MTRLLAAIGVLLISCALVASSNVTLPLNGKQMPVVLPADQIASYVVTVPPGVFSFAVVLHTSNAFGLNINLTEMNGTLRTETSATFAAGAISAIAGSPFMLYPPNGTLVVSLQCTANTSCKYDIWAESQTCQPFSMTTHGQFSLVDGTSACFDWISVQAEPAIAFQIAASSKSATCSYTSTFFSAARGNYTLSSQVDYVRAGQKALLAVDGLSMPGNYFGYLTSGFLPASSFPWRFYIKAYAGGLTSKPCQFTLSASPRFPTRLSLNQQLTLNTSYDQSAPIATIFLTNITTVPYVLNFEGSLNNCSLGVVGNALPQLFSEAALINLWPGGRGVDFLVNTTGPRLWSIETNFETSTQGCQYTLTVQPGE